MLPPYLSTDHVRQLFAMAKAEDLGQLGDITSLATIPADQLGTGEVVSKEAGIVAGLSLLEELTLLYDPKLKLDILSTDGSKVDAGQTLLRMTGSTRSLLAVERPLLNFLQRLSGIATNAHRIGTLLEGSNTQLLDTRKTTPGWRGLEKWAVQLGGGHNHRVGLFDRILLKENHVSAAGGISSAVAKAVRYKSEQTLDVKVEVEVENLVQLEELLALEGVDIVLLDNMDNATLQKAIDMVDGRLLTEASGNMTADRLPSLAGLGLDYISMGALTHSAKALDISLYLR